MIARPRLDPETLALLARAAKAGIMRLHGVALATEIAAGNRRRMQDLISAGLAKVIPGGCLVATAPGRMIAGVKE